MTVQIIQYVINFVYIGSNYISMSAPGLRPSARK